MQQTKLECLYKSVDNPICGYLAALCQDSDYQSCKMFLPLKRNSDVSLRLESMLEDIETKGINAVLLDRCQDREFCQSLGLDYSSKEIAKDMLAMIEVYRQRKKSKEKLPERIPMFDGWSEYK